MKCPGRIAVARTGSLRNVDIRGRCSIRVVVVALLVHVRCHDEEHGQGGVGRHLCVGCVRPRPGAGRWRRGGVEQAVRLGDQRDVDGQHAQRRAQAGGPTGSPAHRSRRNTCGCRSRGSSASQPAVPRRPVAAEVRLGVVARVSGGGSWRDRAGPADRQAASKGAPGVLSCRARQAEPHGSPPSVMHARTCLPPRRRLVSSRRHPASLAQTSLPDPFTG